MYINAKIRDQQLIMYCDLSHENFLNLVDELHKLNYKVEITNATEFINYSKSGNEQENIHTLWVDEDTWETVVKTAEAFAG